jgi:hypothetical protein
MSRPHGLTCGVSFFIYEGTRRNLRLDCGFFSREVDHFGQRALLGLAHGDRFTTGDARHFARRIVQIAEDPALGRTDADARGKQAVLDAVRAEVALLGRMRVRVDEQLIVGTRHHAGAAADARLAVEIDDAVATLEECPRRADADAWRLVALVAEDGKEEPLRLRESAFFDRLHPAAVDADRDLVLGLARDRAGVAADAFSEIDREPVVGHAGVRLYQRQRKAPPRRHREDRHGATEAQRRSPPSHRGTEKIATEAQRHREAYRRAALENQPLYSFRHEA